MDKTKLNNKEIEEKKEELPECFVIMPISDQEGYEDGHFKRVYEDIFIPAIEKAKFKPYRADDAKSSSVIHTTILRRLLEAPMAICDLSSRNPNVLYELGIRQAFDKPVVLVGDDHPSKIFDIGNINTHMYKKSLNYREVIEDQNKIKEMLEETYNNPGKEYNSLISVLKIESALNIDTYNKDFQESDVIKIMYQELISLKGDIREMNNKLKGDEGDEESAITIKDRGASINKKLVISRYAYNKIMKDNESMLEAERGGVSDEFLSTMINILLTGIETFIEKHGAYITSSKWEELKLLRAQLIGKKNELIININ